METYLNQSIAYKLDDETNIDMAVELALNFHVRNLMQRWRRGEPGINIFKDGNRIGVDLPLHLLTKEEVEKNMHEGDTFLSPKETKVYPLCVYDEETEEIHYSL